MSAASYVDEPDRCSSDTSISIIPLLWTVDDVLTGDECGALIRRAEAGPWLAATVNMRLAQRCALSACGLIAMIALVACKATPTLESRIDEFTKTSTVFRGSLLVAKDGAIILHKGYGANIDAETPFWIASISKQFTAAAILRLAEQKKLALDDPLTKFFAGVPDDKKSITVQQLLTHTAGFKQNYAADGIVDRDAAVRALLAQELAAAPGAGFRYSNDGYNLLAAIVEVASKESFEKYLQKELFDPVKLEHTGFWAAPSAAMVAPLARELDPSVRVANWGFRGATGVHSTTGDLYRWYTTSPSIAPLLAPQVTAKDGDRVCYGWFITTTPHGRKRVWTRGTEDFGHNATLFAYPEERIVIVAASNAGDRGKISASRRLVEDLTRLLFDSRE